MGGTTFHSLKDWMLWLLFSAIEHERGATNMQMLLHGILLVLQDIGRLLFVRSKVEGERGRGGRGRERGLIASLKERFSPCLQWCMRVQ